jgi:hypothetical protein
LNGLVPSKPITQLILTLRNNEIHLCLILTKKSAVPQAKPTSNIIVIIRRICLFSVQDFASFSAFTEFFGLSFESSPAASNQPAETADRQ